MSENREIELTRLLISMGKKQENFDEYRMRAAIGNVLSENRALPFSEIAAGKVILNLYRIAAETGLWLPIQFSTIGKTLVGLDPVLKELAPTFDPNQVLKDYASELTNHRLSQQFSYQSLSSSVLESVESLQQLPGKVNDFLDQFSHDEFTVKLKLSESQNVTENFEKVANRITIGLILAALIVGSTLLMRIDTSFKLFGYPGFAILMFVISADG